MKKVKKILFVFIAISIVAFGYAFTSSNFGGETQMTKVIVTIDDNSYVENCGGQVILYATGNGTHYQDYDNSDTYTFFISGVGSGFITANLTHECGGGIRTTSRIYSGSWNRTTIYLTIGANDICQ